MKRPSLLLIGALALGALSLPACNKSGDSAQKKETKTSEPADTKKTARTKTPVDEGIDVPTEEDFEEIAANEITEESDLQKELDKLEKEIGQ